MAKQGDTLRNGATVVAIGTDRDPLRFATVLALTAPEDGREYVVWTLRLEDGATFQGDYCATFSDAVEAFTSRQHS